MMCVKSFLILGYSNPLLLLLSTIIIQFYSTVLLLVAKDYHIQDLIVETLRNIPEKKYTWNTLSYKSEFSLNLWCCGGSYLVSAIILLYYHDKFIGKTVKNQNHIFFQNCYAFSLLILHGFVCLFFFFAKIHGFVAVFL